MERKGTAIESRALDTLLLDPELHGDGDVYFLRLAVQLIGFILPLTNGCDGGGSKNGVAAHSS